MAGTSRSASLQETQNQRGRSDHNSGDMHARIRQRAYELYEKRGRRDGHDEEDWVQAEREVRGDQSHPRAA